MKVVKKRRSIRAKSPTENDDEDEEAPSNVNVQIIRGIGEKSKGGPANRNLDIAIKSKGFL